MTSLEPAKPSQFGDLMRALLLGVLCVVSLSAGALSLTGFTNNLVGYLLEQVSTPGQFEVRADVAEDDPSGRTALVNVRIVDATGVWFTAERIAFAWSPARLLRGEVQIDELALEDAHLMRLPQVPPAASAPDKAAAPASNAHVPWPRSPIAAYLKTMVIRNMRIADTVLPGGLVFNANGSLRDEGDEQSLQLTLKRTDQVRGDIRVQYRKTFSSGDLNLQVQANEASGGSVAVLAGLPPDVPVALTLNGAGAPDDWRGQLDLGAVGMLAVKGDLEAKWQQRISARLGVTLTTGRKLSPALRDGIGSEAKLAVVLTEDAGGVIQVRQASLAGAALQVQGSGWYSREDGRMDLKTNGTIDAQAARRLQGLLAPARFGSAEFSASVSGKAGALTISTDANVTALSMAGFALRRAQLQVRARNTIAESLAVDLQLKGRGPRGPDPSYDPILGNAVQLALSGRVQTDSAQPIVHLERLHLNMPSLQADLAGQVVLADDVVPKLRYSAKLADLRSFTKLAGVSLAGSASARGSIAGTASALTIDGDMQLRQSVVNGQKLGNVTLVHTAKLAADTRVRADLKMRSADFGAGRARADLRVAASGFSARGVEVDLLDITAKGDLNASRDAKRLGGTLTLSVKSLAKIGRLTGLRLAGTGTGRVQLGRDKGGRADIELSLSDVEVEQNSIASARVSVRASAISSVAQLSGTVRATSANVGELGLDSLELDFAGPLSGTQVRVSAAGLLRELPVRLASSLQLGATNDRAATRRVRVENLRLSLAKEIVELERPLIITATDAGFELRDLALRLPDNGHVTGTAKGRDGIVTMAMKLRTVPLRLAQTFASVPIISGSLSGELNGVSAGAKAGLDLDAKLVNLQFDGTPAGVGALGGQLRASWDGRQLRSNAVISGGFGDPIKAQVSVPLMAQKRGAPQLAAKAPLSAEAQWRGDVAKLLEQLPLSDHLLAGATALDVRVAGTVAKPIFDGALHLRDGRYENLLTGTLLTALDFESTFAGDGAVVLKLSASDGVNGQVQADANISGLGAGGETSVAAQIGLRQLLAVRLDQAVAELDGDINVSGTSAALKVRGIVDVRRAEIRLLNNLPPSVTDLGEVRTKGAPRRKQDSESASAPSSVALDLKINMDDKIFVRGRGLESEWGGALEVSGSAAEPLVAGRIGVRKGRFDLLGRMFQFSRGEVTFDGASEVDPVLDIALERTANDITGGMAVSGRASAPVLEFTSTPALPSDEVLPRILFGRASSSMSATEALQLAAGIVALTGGQAGVVDKIRTAIGVDVLNIDAGEREDSSAALNVGRYVRDGVYVGAKQALDGTSTSVVIEAEVTKNIVIDADVGHTGQTSVGVSWRKDF
jgi:translocation and assembly module TamB